MMKDENRKAMFAKLNRINLRSNRLPVQIRIIVPSTEGNKRITKKRYDRRVHAEKRYFIERFGADTSIQEVGSYKGDGGEIIKEEGTIVESSTTPQVYEQKKRYLAKHIMARQKQWKQQTILYGVEGETFIYPKKKYIGDWKSKTKIQVT